MTKNKTFEREIEDMPMERKSLRRKHIFLSTTICKEEKKFRDG